MSRLAALVLMTCVACFCVHAEPAPEPGAANGFAETAPPMVELGVTETKAVAPDAPDSNAKSVPNSPEQDVIAEVGRLMATPDANPATAAPAPRGDTSATGYMYRGIVALAFVLGLILVIYKMLSAYSRKNPLLTALAGSSLATVLGKVHLGRGISLNYVQTGGRVLIVGVTPTTVSLVAEFDADAFETSRAAEAEEAPETTPRTKTSFLELLRSNNAKLSDKAPVEDNVANDPDIVRLRGDIERLQRHLQDLSHDTRE